MKTLKNALAICVLSVFAFVSAQAGELTVSGSMKIASTTQGGDTTGNPLGQDKELSITGSTELDNGITASYKQTITDAFAFNDSELMFGTSFGTIGLSSTGGTIEDVDNIVPTAFEEAEALIGFTTTTGWIDVGTTDGTYGIVYKNAIPGTGMNFTGYYTPKGQTGDATVDDGVSGVGNDNNGRAYSVMLRGNPLNAVDGVDFTIGYENLSAATSTDTAKDEESYTAALNYTYGPIKVGHQQGWLGTGSHSPTGTEGYHNKYTGIAFAVNENLSVSYQYVTSEKRQWDNTSTTTKIDGYSLAYTVGGATLAVVRNDAKNANYNAGTSKTGNQIALALAF